MRSGSRPRCERFAARVGILLAWMVSFGCSSTTASGSVGVMLGHNKRTGALTVRDVPSGLAGYKAGLRSGDRIKMIDGHLVDPLDPKRVRELLRGPVGSKVTLTVIRGSEVVHVEVTREALGTKSGGKPAGSSPPK